MRKSTLAFLGVLLGAGAVFLAAPGRLGIEARAAALRAKATAAQGVEIDAALARLTGAGREAMGELLKVIAFADPKLGALPGFDS